MNATLTAQDQTNRYEFSLIHEKREYNVIIYVSHKGKFIDDEIFYDGEELEFEGEEGQIREDILTYFDENWEKLVK